MSDLTSGFESVTLPVHRDSCNQRGSPDFSMPALPWGQVHTILTRYSEMTPGGKLTWQEIGDGARQDLPEGELWRMTVACKLERCPKAPIDPARPGSEYYPVVEQVLYGEVSAAELRNRIEEEERLLCRGGKTFQWITPQIAMDKKQLERIQRNLRRLRTLSDEKGSLYERGMEYLARAFGECVAKDPSFWPFVEGAGA